MSNVNSYGSVSKQRQKPRMTQTQGKGEDDKKVSTLSAYVQMVKGNLGPGCLALPYAFSHGGLVESSVVFAVVISAVIFGMISLLNCKRSIRSHPSQAPQTYGDVAYEILGPVGKAVADILLVLLQGGVCAVQVDFVATTLSAFIPISQRILSALCLPVFLGLSCILSLKKLTPFVTMALAAMVTAVVVVVFLALDQIKDHGVEPRGALPSWELPNLPVLFGAILYAFEGITLVLPIESQMARPEQCKGMIVVAMSTVAAIFFTVAMLSYLAFGVISSASITVELEERGASNVVFAINILLIMATVLSYPLQLIPVAEVLEDYLDARPKQYSLVPQTEGSSQLPSAADSRVLERRLFRMGITVICVALAIMCSSQLSLAMAVVGSLCGAGLGLVLPSVMNLSRGPSGVSAGGSNLFVFELDS